ncbi:MAG: fimbria/pilus periplasmic chaperone [Neisseriaceae bacterium]|nr:fimbria/pilus periplasmic chaperone [Neisseriaceae bacterium]MBP6861271.1 fimbria/pilus periplasmic chaperone [Neisseriaceae bacterium]
MTLFNLKPTASGWPLWQRLGLAIQASLLMLLLILSSAAHASFQLESTGIILPQTEKRVSFNIQNVSSSPILLVTKLLDLDGQDYSKHILISPPITRIDAGQSQQVNFVLKDGVQLTHEVLLKASFEGVSQAAENTAKMPVRQEVGFLIQPASVPQNKTPWMGLSIQSTANQLTVSNPSKHVVRLAPQITLLPSGKVIPLTDFYLLPGQSEQLQSSGHTTSVTIIPLSRYGFKLPDVTLPVDPS